MPEGGAGQAAAFSTIMLVPEERVGGEMWAWAVAPRPGSAPARWPRPSPGEPQRAGFDWGAFLAPLPQYFVSPWLFYSGPLLYPRKERTHSPWPSDVCVWGGRQSPDSFALGSYLPSLSPWTLAGWERLLHQ